MVTVMFVSAWGAHAARTTAEVSDSLAESLLGVGVAVKVDITPNATELPADVPSSDSALELPVKPSRKPRTA